MELKVCFLGAVRRRTFICCRNVRISASIAAHDRNRSTTIQTMSLTRFLITQQHRPILDQLLVRLSLRQGQVWFRSAAIWTSTAEWRSLLAPSRFLALRASSLPEMQQDAQRGQAFLLSNFWHYFWFLNTEKSRGDGDSKVVQSDEGVWVHSAGCRRQGRLRSYISR